MMANNLPVSQDCFSLSSGTEPIKGHDRTSRFRGVLQKRIPDWQDIITTSNMVLQNFDHLPRTTINWLKLSNVG